MVFFFIPFIKPVFLQGKRVASETGLVRAIQKKKSNEFVAIQCPAWMFQEASTWLVSGL